MELPLTTQQNKDRLSGGQQGVPCFEYRLIVFWLLVGKVNSNRRFVSTPKEYYIKKFDTLHHQSLLVPVQFHRYFNTKCKICADEAHNIEMLIEGRQFEFCPLLLGFHLPGGVSGDPEKVRKERRIIQQQLKDFAASGIIPDRI